jgi:hypothetical protein
MTMDEEITLTGELVQLKPPMVRVTAATASGRVLASAQGPLDELERLRDEVMERARDELDQRRAEDDGAG